MYAHTLFPFAFFAAFLFLPPASPRPLRSAPVRLSKGYALARQVEQRVALCTGCRGTVDANFNDLREPVGGCERNRLFSLMYGLVSELILTLFIVERSFKVWLRYA